MSRRPAVIASTRRGFRDRRGRRIAGWSPRSDVLTRSPPTRGQRPGRAGPEVRPAPVVVLLTLPEEVRSAPARAGQVRGAPALAAPATAAPTAAGPALPGPALPGPVRRPPGATVPAVADDGQTAPGPADPDRLVRGGRGPCRAVPGVAEDVDLPADRRPAVGHVRRAARRLERAGPPRRGPGLACGAVRDDLCGLGIGDAVAAVLGALQRDGPRRVHELLLDLVRGERRALLQEQGDLAADHPGRLRGPGGLGEPGAHAGVG